MGIATLRMAMLPNEVPPDRREMVLMAGRGSYMMATRQTAAASTAFQALAERYSETPNVHYAYGVFLLLEQPDKAIEQFKRELALQPNDAASLLQIAYEYLKQKNAEAALPWAKQAVEVAPNSFGSHKALGDAFLELGDVEGALRELQTAARLAPDSPSTRLSLARAFQRAGRTDDATREREEFARLDRLMRTTRTGAESVGGIDPNEPRPSSPPPR
jgi:tetratricopeptide (TPR) repeat protein